MKRCKICCGRSVLWSGSVAERAGREEAVEDELNRQIGEWRTEAEADEEGEGLEIDWMDVFTREPISHA